MSMLLILALLLQDVEGLIRRLGADSFAERQQAVEELARLGKAAVPALERAAEGSDPEIAARARQTLDRIRYGGLFDRRGGADPLAEAGLEWLVRHQAPDGSWAGTFVCCPGKGPSAPDPGMTGLAALAFLAAGRKPSTCLPLRRALERLAAWQAEDGRIGPPGEKPMYGHVIGALALAEGFSYGEAEEWRGPAQKAADWTVAARDPKFGWRYTARSKETDTSVTIWATLSLSVGRRVGLRVPKEAFAGAQAWLEVMTDPAYGRVVYHPRNLKCGGLGPEPEFGPHETMTGGASFARRLMGLPADEPLLLNGRELLLRDRPTARAREVDFSYWHFGSLAIQHVADPEGRAPKLWEPPLLEALRATRRAEGCGRGSWDPVDAWSPEGGRVYATALNVLTLQTRVRYRLR